MAGIEGEAKFDTVLTSITNRGIHALWNKPLVAIGQRGAVWFPTEMAGRLWRRENSFPFKESNSCLDCDMDSSMDLEMDV